MSYRVTAPCVIAKDQDGHSQHYYEGAVIPWLSDAQAAHLLDENMVAEVNGGSALGLPPGTTISEGGPPAKTALKDEWVAYAVSKGADEAEADGLTKPELIDLYGE
jgi:hypothetical protein